MYCTEFVEPETGTIAGVERFRLKDRIDNQVRLLIVIIHVTSDPFAMDINHRLPKLTSESFIAHRDSADRDYIVSSQRSLRDCVEQGKNLLMTPQERALLSDLFDRLRHCEGIAKEPDAAAFIADAIARQPGAPYFMAQLLLVQDQALAAAQARIRALEQTTQSAGKAMQQTAASRFLPETRQAQAELPQGPWGAYRPNAPETDPAQLRGAATYPGPASPQSQAVGSGVGGFLRGALQTATGVAGGALLFQGISSLFHHWGHAMGTGRQRLPARRHRTDADRGNGHQRVWSAAALIRSGSSA